MSTALHTAFDLLQKRANVIAESRKLIDATLGVGKEMTAEQRGQLEAMEKDVVALKEQADILQRQEARESELRARSDEPVRPALPGDPAPHEPQRRSGEEAPWLKEARNFFRTARVGESLVQTEKRALAADGAASGGYLIQPGLLSDLIREKDNMVYIRQKARKLRLTTTDEISLPTLASKPTSFAWGAELTAPTPDTAMAFGRRTLRVNPARGLIKVSRKMLRLSDPPAERTVREEFAALFGQKEEEAFFSGTGAGQPLGMMVESDSGIPASRSYSTGNTTTLVKFDGITGAIYQVKKQYREGAEFFFPRNVMAQIRKEKDGQGQYLWQPSVVLGQPDMILGYPVSETEYITATPATGELVGLFGNLQEYLIADGLDLEVQVLVEAFYATDEVGFKFSVEMDGKPRDVNAFARIKLA